MISIPLRRRSTAATTGLTGGAAITVEGLTGGYTRAPVLRDVNLHVQPGEIVALFGANGAGKTSLLRALSGTLPTCQGRIHLADRRVDHATPWRRVKYGLAHVPEGRHVFPSMTVRENLLAGSLTRPGNPPLDHVYDLFPRLAERQRQLAGTLSGGEQQMVALGRALMSRPSVLLIDEMSAGLAPVLTHRLVEALTRIRGDGVTILLVEQAPHMVADVIDRAYLLNQGRVVAQGTLAELGGNDAIAAHYLGVR
jgi:branched-chain amino acid transport system ATP-binding protein